MNINHKSQALGIMRLVSNDNRRDECVCGSVWHYHIARRECVHALCEGWVSVWLWVDEES